MLAVAAARLKKLAICGLTSLLASALVAPIQAEELPLTDAPAATAEYDSPIVNGDVDSFVFHDEAELAAYYQQGPATSSGRSTSSTPRSQASSAGQSRFGTAGSTYGQTAFSRPTYMIADNSGGGCGGLFIQGSLVASIMHPTFACSRLNIAENNSPIIQDRAYFSYRHFENASGVSVFPTTPAGGQAKQDINRYTLGLEKKFFNLFSVEARVPFNTELSSNLFFAQFPNERSVLPLHDLENVLGNMGLIAKVPLYVRDTFYFSGGVALNFPTAPDVHINGLVDDPNFAIRDPVTGAVIRRVDVDLRLSGVVRNQTVNVSPFFAFYAQPTERVFTQGFCQVDIAANESRGSLDLAYGVNGFFPAPFSETALIAQQTLMRLNYGVGYWLIQDPDARWLNQLGTMLELHYTNTLNNADLLGPVEVIKAQPALNISAVNLAVGNLSNRVDTLNLAFGIPMRIGATTITNGFIMPLRTGDNRGFDFEYNLLLNRNF